MRAIIKKVHSPDTLNLENYCPDDPENFSLLLQFLIGPVNGEGEESFDVEIYTPKWILANFKKEDVIYGRHKIIVLEYNLKAIIDSVSKYISGCSGDTWLEIAQKINRIGRWEFEDYAA